MKKKIYILSFVVALTLGMAAFISGFAGRSEAAPSGDAASALPASDIVVTVDTQRLLSETMPTIFADNPTLLAKVNDKIEQFKSEVGVDLRTFDSVAVGLRFSSPSGNDFDAVVIARGHFNANQVIDAGFAAGEKKGEVQRREEQYEGKTIYIAVPQRRQSATPTTNTTTTNTNSSVNLNPNRSERRTAILQARPSTNTNVAPSQPTLGEKADVGARAEVLVLEGNDQYDVKVKKGGPEQMAVVALDANTLAVGDVKSVRAAIDASLGRERVDDELVRMASQNPSALVGFSGRIPANMTEKMRNAKGGVESKYFASIRQFYGSFSTVGTDAEVFIAARTENATQANDISQALNAMKLLSGLSITHPSKGEIRSLASILKDLSITAQNNEVQIKLNIKQKDLAPFMRKF